MPLFRCFRLDIVEKVFVQHGIYLFEKFPDGQTRWCNQPKPEQGKQFSGRSSMANPYEPYSTDTGTDYYDVFTLRGIIHRLGKEEALIMAAIEEADVTASEKD